ncbi:hypothetical protein MWN63_03370 [Paradonghicola geojensis]|nr:hypothetical protein [Marivivens geojensis]
MEDVWHSRLFNVHAWSEHKAVMELTEYIFRSLDEEQQKTIRGRANNRGKTDLYKHLRIVLTDLYVGWKTDPTLCTALSFNRNDYRVGSRYNGLHISHRVTDVCHILEDQGYIRISKGGYDRVGDGRSNRTARLFLTDRLKTLFSEVGLESWQINQHQDQECIILRNKDIDSRKAKDIPYEETDQTTAMRMEVNALNELLSQHYVDITFLRRPFILRTQQQGNVRNPELIPVDQGQKFMRRIFSRSRWDCDGRWYGGFWQSARKGSRRHIRIDNEITDEVDFDGLHPALLAARHGVVSEGDKYDLKEHICEEVSQFVQRDTVKKLVLVAINAKDRSSAFRAFRLKFDNYSNKTLSRLLDAFIDRHPYLNDELCSDQGIHLMHTDSLITTHIINEFVAAKKPILPIHDSYIVKSKERLFLDQAMSKATIAVVGTDLTRTSRINEEDRLFELDRNYRASEDYDPMYGFEDYLEPLIEDVSEEYLKRYEQWLAKKS